MSPVLEDSPQGAFRDLALDDPRRNIHQTGAAHCHRYTDTCLIDSDGAGRIYLQRLTFFRELPVVDACIAQANA